MAEPPTPTMPMASICRISRSAALISSKCTTTRRATRSSPSRTKRRTRIAVCRPCSACRHNRRGCCIGYQEHRASVRVQSLSRMCGQAAALRSRALSTTVRQASREQCVADPDAPDSFAFCLTCFSGKPMPHAEYASDSLLGTDTQGDIEASKLNEQALSFLRSMSKTSLTVIRDMLRGVTPFWLVVMAACRASAFTMKCRR